MNQPLYRVCLHDRAVALVGEQIDGVRGVVPQQVVGPAARLAQRVGVRAAEKIGLHVHLQETEFSGGDLLVHILVAGVEAAGVAAHRDQAGLLLQRHHFLSALERVGERNFDLDMLAGLQACQRLFGMQLRRRAENDGIDFGQRQAARQVGADMRNAVFVGDLAGFFQVAADQRDDFDAVDVLDAVEVLDAEGAGARQGDFDNFVH